jgi:hypothetical protein
MVLVIWMVVVVVVVVVDRGCDCGWGGCRGLLLEKRAVVEGGRVRWAHQ